MTQSSRPRIGITADLEAGNFLLKPNYVDAVLAAGGVPYILPARTETILDALDTCDGIVISGGDDIDMRLFGLENHASVEIMDSRRQEAELTLLRALDARPDVPVLGICLGMQLMGVHAGGTLIQHLPDVIDDGEAHRNDRLHAIHGAFGEGLVASHHHQALADTGRLKATAHADDGVIEALEDAERPFYVGVQWHPERTPDPAFGVAVIRRLVEAAARRRG